MTNNYCDLSRSTLPGPAYGPPPNCVISLRLRRVQRFFSCIDFVGDSRVIVAIKGTDRWQQQICDYFGHRLAGGRSHSIFNKLSCSDIIVQVRSLIQGATYW
jgi:hypothetical protein